ALDADIGPAPVNGGADFEGRPMERRGELAADRIGKLHMADYPLAEKSRGPFPLGAVEELIGDDDIAGDDLLLHAPHRRNGDDPLDTQLLHAVDVRPVGNLGGEEAVAAAVTGEEDQLHSLKG